jgi:hypothetical protein
MSKGRINLIGLDDMHSSPPLEIVYQSDIVRERFFITAPNHTEAEIDAIRAGLEAQSSATKEN